MFQVTDLANAAQFYREMLGLKQEIYSEESQWAEFSKTVMASFSEKLRVAGKVTLDQVINISEAAAEL